MTELHGRAAPSPAPMTIPCGVRGVGDPSPGAPTAFPALSALRGWTWGLWLVEQPLAVLMGRGLEQRRAGGLWGGVHGGEVPPPPSRALPAVSAPAKRFMAGSGEGAGRGGGKQVPRLSPALGAASPRASLPPGSPCPLQPPRCPRPHGVPRPSIPTGDPTQRPGAGDKPGAPLHSASLINQC